MKSLWKKSLKKSRIVGVLVGGMFFSPLVSASGILPDFEWKVSHDNLQVKFRLPVGSSVRKPKSPKPFRVKCKKGKEKSVVQAQSPQKRKVSHSEWKDDTTWTYSFSSRYPTGSRCVFRVVPKLKFRDGQSIVDPLEFEVTVP